MTGMNLWNEVCLAQDPRGMIAALSADAFCVLSDHVISEGEMDGDGADICGLVAVEGWCRFLTGHHSSSKSEVSTTH